MKISFKQINKIFIYLLLLFNFNNLNANEKIIDKVLKQQVKNMDGLLPLKLPDGQMKKVFTHNKTIFYYFYINMNYEEYNNSFDTNKKINNLIKENKENYLKTMCLKQNMRELLSIGGKFQYSYYSLDDYFLFDVYLKEEDCIELKLDPTLWKIRTNEEILDMYSNVLNNVEIKKFSDKEFQSFMWIIKSKFDIYIEKTVGLKKLYSKLSNLKKDSEIQNIINIISLAEIKKASMYYHMYKMIPKNKYSTLYMNMGDELNNYLKNGDLTNFNTNSNKAYYGLDRNYLKNQMKNEDFMDILNKSYKNYKKIILKKL